MDQFYLDTVNLIGDALKIIHLAVRNLVSRNCMLKNPHITSHAVNFFISIKKYIICVCVFVLFCIPKKYLEKLNL